MKKIFLPLLLLAGIFFNAASQTLFTYGGQPVTAKEFLAAWKNNTGGNDADRSKSIREYLELYIKSKLKVREAYARGYDTLPHLVTEVSNLRAQVVEKYMTDPAIKDRMLKEVFDRSQKDIHVAHIYISYVSAAGVIDSLAAQQKRDELVNRLKKGEDFLKLAQQYSNDPAAKTNKGDVGFITVFTLPYEFETAIYNTPKGKFSEPVRSKAGFHIFKVLGERKAAGKMKAQQILLAFPPDADAATRKRIGMLADSLYRQIMKGEDFGQLARAFSNDYISAATGGNIPDISVGQFDPAFEKALWALPKDGAVSKPVQTAHGWHILKRVTLKPVVTDPADAENLKELEQQLVADRRWKSSSDFIYKEVMDKAGVNRQSVNTAALWAYADSLLNRMPMRAEGRTINPGQALFTIDTVHYTVQAWIDYARAYRFRPDGSGAKPHDQVLDEWEKFCMVNYYRDHLENFNEEFRDKMTGFTDGNLFFEIMQQEVWNKAQADTAALLELYNLNPAKYTWDLSADVIVFFCTDPGIAPVIYDSVKKNPARWRAITMMYNERVFADSARYEWNQVPNLNKIIPTDGMMTSPLVNNNDQTASFAYIVKVYPQPTQRSFQEARSMLTNDYQLILDKRWEEELRKKYPVVVNQKVLEEISK